MNFPIDKLAVIVGELFDLSGDTRLSSDDRAKAYQTANQLHTYSEILAQKQFDSTKLQYTTAINSMNQISTDLAQAADNIDELSQAVADASSLVGAVEELLKTAATFGLP